jgi:hypothetical protein
MKLMNLCTFLFAVGVLGSFSLEIVLLDALLIMLTSEAIEAALIIKENKLMVKNCHESLK